MKIFSQQESTTQATEGSSTKGPHGKKRAATPEKKQVSEREVREKLAAHVETSNTAKSKVLQQNSKQLGAGFMNEEMKPAPVEVKKAESAPASEEENKDEKKDSVQESHLLMSDVKLNDPKDPATQEKLKTVLAKGAFNFNPKERETLDKILNGN